MDINGSKLSNKAQIQMSRIIIQTPSTIMQVYAVNKPHQLYGDYQQFSWMYTYKWKTPWNSFKAVQTWANDKNCYDEGANEAEDRES